MPLSDLHPAVALKGSQSPPALIASCEHFAGSERFVRKAFELQTGSAGTFDVTCDCEDGSELGQETRQRDMFVTLIQERAAKPHKGRVGIRLHDLSSPHFAEDVRYFSAALRGVVDYVVVPKVHDAKEALSAAQLVERSFRTPMALHFLIETPGALRDVHAIAEIPGVETLDFGIMDFVAELAGAIPGDAIRSPQQFDHPLLRHTKASLALAALGHGVVPSHNVTLDFSSGQPAEDDARRALLEFGFLRMWSIHPVQIEGILRAFSPSAGDVEKSSRVLLNGYRASWGPTRDGNELHDRASYRIHWQRLNRAHENGALLSDEILGTFF